LFASLEASGLRVQPFRFESEGLRAWSVREGRNQVQAENS
jgi:D-glycero-alpha-D-manno-heptose-7-phosphate kinase